MITYPSCERCPAQEPLRGYSTPGATQAPPQAEPDALFNYAAGAYLCASCDRRETHSEWLRVALGARRRSRQLQAVMPQTAA